MKKFLLYSLGLIFLFIIGGLSYVKFALPNVGEPEQLSIKATPEMIARGEYLANHVMLCMDCHSIRDFSLYGGPYDHTKAGQGGELFSENMGLPGQIYSRNITPANLKSWTDGEIFRAITTGVNKDGKALFPLMPYKNYAQLDREDLYAIIAYIRTIPSIEHEVIESSFDFPMNFIINTIPQKVEVKNKRPSSTDQVAYGKYLVTAASCRECHTQQEKGEFKLDLEFAGGMEFNFGDGKIVRSANISTDLETGIGGWTMEQFVNKFRGYRDSVFVPTKLKEDEVNTAMPWLQYAGMKDSDLEAIYSYLQTVKPVKNEVQKYGIAKK